MGPFCFPGSHPSFVSTWVALAIALAHTPLFFQSLFKQFDGFKEVRMVPSRPGLAFIEYDDEAHVRCR